jgi:anti-sigma factor RsiW
VTHSERDLRLGLRERESSEAVHAVIRASLSDYLDGSLPRPELDETRQHLDSCTDCQAYWRTLLRLINTTGQLPRRSLSQAARERLAAQLEGAAIRS